MAIDFCPGYAREPFATLVRDTPDSDIYPQKDFRVEWGPVYHRGRLDGSSRLLIIGQDPAQHEQVARRVMIGTAGRRVQGLLAKLGLTRSYTIINTFLYAVYGQFGGEKHAKDVAIATYRDRWISALVEDGVEAVITVGHLADAAFAGWSTRNPTSAAKVKVAVHMIHPTQPESASKGNPTELARLTELLLKNWNVALAEIFPQLSQRDVNVSLVPYGRNWGEDETPPIPMGDLPAGCPSWMGETGNWAARPKDLTPEMKRRTITIVAPASSIVVQADADAPLSARSTRKPIASPLSLTAANRIRSAASGRAMGRTALAGDVVTLDASSRVLKKHTIYIQDGLIVDVRPNASPVPVGFESVETLATGGLIYPGLIDLHNHLAYNALPLWRVPKKFQSREQWGDHPDYERLVSKPMQVIGNVDGVLPALCRYVECKCLIGGGVASQGIKLVNQEGITRYFRGLLRNVELPGDPALPAASARIGDVDAANVEAFFKTLSREKTCYLLHLSEGVNDAARKHFLALKRPNGKWAMTDSLAGIHAAALSAADFDILAEHGASIVWSPLSNLMLYGGTAKVKAAKEAGVRIAIGTDWSPSGSKNMLGELKVVKGVNAMIGAPFSDEDLVRMATSQAAGVLKWDHLTGSIEPGKLADLIVVKGKASDPYGSLIAASELDVRLVMLGGAARYGIAELVSDAPGTEEVRIGGQKRRINPTPLEFEENEGDTELEGLSLAESIRRLEHVLESLGQVDHVQRAMRSLNPFREPQWKPMLDEFEGHGRLRMPRIEPSAATATRRTPKPPLTLAPIKLDGLCVVDDTSYQESLQAQLNVPREILDALLA